VTIHGYEKPGAKMEDVETGSAGVRKGLSRHHSLTVTKDRSARSVFTEQNSTVYSVYQDIEAKRIATKEREKKHNAGVFVVTPRLLRGLVGRLLY
jgi:hypothetical protein